ncbi:hypothetical protein [Protaetiibacter larvae]|uniref:DUF2339 domain-containing protein n=1 Tax=Protaetiibacter larvae TaxID=2592654 RepID=A0A5C1Y7M6_9MICO|nr:hypothetical protein [Protaetiibacter larvae]QEO09195.1 hypothetical protein FLP23_03705 [Protaetiibacter larvae]
MRAVIRTGWRVVVEFVQHVVIDQVRDGRLRDLGWPLGLRPVVTVGVVGYVVAALLVLLSGPLREWIPLASQSGAVIFTLPRAIVWLLLALTALSMTLAACGALHARAWFRWLTVGLVIVVLLFTTLPDQHELPLSRIVTILASVGLIVFVAIRGGRGFRWWEFAVVGALVWGPLVVTAGVLTAINRPFGFDFLPILLSLMLSSLGQLAVPAAIAAGAAVANVTTSAAVWAGTVVRRVVGVRAVVVLLVLAVIWRGIDVGVGIGAILAEDARVRAVLGGGILLALIAVSWFALARMRAGRGAPNAVEMIDGIDALALAVAAFTTTSVLATPVILVGNVAVGFGAPQGVADVLLAVAEFLADTAVVFGVRLAGGVVLLALAVVQARRGRRTTPELMAAVGIASVLIAATVLFEFPLLWSPEGLELWGAVLAVGVLLVAIIRRRVSPARATAVLVALLLSALFAYRDIVTDPIAFLLGFAGGAVVLFGFVWSFLTGYKIANQDSRAYPRPARVQLALANAVFSITVLAFLALARDPDAAVALGDLAAFGGQSFGDPLVAAVLLLALWAALRNRELDEESPPAERPGEDVASPEAEAQNAGTSTVSR